MKIYSIIHHRIQPNIRFRCIVSCLEINITPKYHLVSFQVIVNGEGEHPVFNWLKVKLPIPRDDTESLMGDPKFIIWKPVKRSDISWNFEKFLIDQNGRPVKRFSKSFQTCDIDKDIDALLR